MDESAIRRDMSDDFIERLARLLDNLEISKLQAYQDPSNLHLINFYLHQINLWLHRKMTKEEKDKQTNFYKSLKVIKPLSVKKRENHYGEIVSYYVPTKEFQNYKDLIEERELHLYSVLERTGLTAKGQKKKFT